MFEGRQYKKQALGQLRGHWKTPILITLFTGIVFGIITLPQILITLQSEGDITSLPLSVVGTVAAAIFEIALAKYYLSFTARSGKAAFSMFLENFNLWLRGIAAFFWVYLWTFLWSLLFIIPGIIKALAYSQTLYIVAEHPHIPVRKAIKISMEMTKGYKADLFLLELSFIGWAFLASFTFGIGYLWLIPYMGATFANTYRYLKENALQRGVLTNEDFGLPAIEQDA